MSHPHLSHPKYRPDVDGLRAVAVLAVVIFHAFPDLVRGGFVGVDIFFVISGYLISTIIFENLHKGTFSFVEFYVRRIRRIFPALVVVLVACYALGWLVLLPPEYKQLGAHVAGGAAFISNYLLWHEAGYFDNAAVTKPLLHLWSLGVEEQFYIVWPLLLWVSFRMRFNLLAVGLIVASVSFYLNIKGIKSDPVATYYSPQTRFWELMGGSVLAWMTLYRATALNTVKEKLGQWLTTPISRLDRESGVRLSANLISALGLLLLVYGFWRIDKYIGFPGKWAVIPVLGTMLIIYGGSAAWVNRTILSNKIVIWFGLISFPLYLWHWPLLSFARIIETQVPGAGIRIGLIALSVVLGWLTYKLVERPLRFGGRGLIKVVSLVSVCALVGLVGLLTDKSDIIAPRIAVQYGADPALTKFDEMLSKNPQYIRQMDVDRFLAVREPRCHLARPGESFEEYKLGNSACVKLMHGKKNVLVIGDSHAADFYMALSETDKHINVLQATGAGCTGILSVYSSKGDRCYKLIKYALDFAVNNRLDYVVLASRWPDDFSGLSAEIRRLKEAGVKVIIVGPAAEFREYSYKFLYRRRLDDDEAGLSARYFNPEKLVLNERMKNFAKVNNVQYIDRIAPFCNSRGMCSLMDKNSDLYLLDYGHLSQKGAQFLGHSLPESEIFR